MYFYNLNDSKEQWFSYSYSWKWAVSDTDLFMIWPFWLLPIFDRAIDLALFLLTIFHWKLLEDWIVCKRLLPTKKITRIKTKEYRIYVSDMNSFGII